MTHIRSIGSVMTPFPYLVQIDDSLLVARSLMLEHSIRHLCEGGDTLVGVLTDRVLKRALDPNPGLPREEELFVRDVFVPDAYVVDRTERLVTKNGRLVGMFTLVDAARMYCQHLRALFPSTSSAEIA